MPQVTPELLRRLPKTDLHLHLDGSLRPSTLIELAREEGVELPAWDAVGLADHMRADDARDLVEYLGRFEITLAVMQRAYALERIAFELVEDAAAEGVRYLEVRFSPLLNVRGGLKPDEVLDAVNRGLLRGEGEFGVGSAVIVCALRNLPPESSVELAELAIAHRDRGVVGFDLAGPERDHPAREHREAFLRAGRANLALTCHAGEAEGPESILQALHDCGARRIGHGTRLFEDPELMSYVNDFRIPLEVCLTSNVQTRATRGFAEHPAGLYYDQGLVVTLNTDNRLMSGTSVTEEFWRAHRHLGFSWSQLADMALMGFQSAFLPHGERTALVTEMAKEIESLARAGASETGA